MKKIGIDRDDRADRLIGVDGIYKIYLYTYIERAFIIKTGSAPSVEVCSKSG
ncbi:MAG: hypothetical protein K0S30_845 [Clostridia bacterium]|jgi:hypothetical protein|nr:hypothetical protein [Clostridia bacterium]